MSERLKKLYRSEVMKMAELADNSSIPQGHTHQLKAYNPMCGDKFSIYLNIENGIIQTAGMQGFGCAISKASTYLLTKTLSGRTLVEAQEIIKHFLEMTNEDSDRKPEDIFKTDEFLAFAAAREFPERKSCANMSWEESANLLQKLH